MSDTEIVQEFLVESYENLDRLDRELVSLEKQPGDTDTLASIFRTIHTIKGTCGFLGFSKLEAVAHVGENLLSKLRDGLVKLTPKSTTALLAMVDAVRQMLTSIEATGQEGERNDAKLIAKLNALLKGESPAPTVTPPDPIPTIGELLIKNAGASESQVNSAVEKQSQNDPRHLGEILVEEGTVKPADVVEALHTQQTARAQTSVADSTIRVDVGLLDKLMNLVGELVLARNQILQFTNSSEDSGLTATSQRLNLLTTEIQAGVMKTRMQPIGNIWSKFPRTVRDLAVMCGKEVSIEMEGQETELDKTIIESIKDPLTHIVRNTVDHGIETPDVRRAARKNPAGRLHLRAFHEGGQVIIEISDDGAGLNIQKIRRKAIERSLITAEQGSHMTDGDIYNLIFLPGFSTAEKVTNVSGRGVGMDVVKTNVEKIGGTVDVQSKPGHGTTVRIKIPLTLAIIPALVVTCSGDRFAIPQVSLTELVRLEADEVEKGIEMVHGVPVYRLRGQLLPLIYLSEELNIEKDPHNKDAGQDGAVNIVVLQSDGQPFGMVVDTVNDTEEIVVKPLRKQLKSIKTFAGASIMGDGRVALILDVMGLAQRSKVISDRGHQAVTETREELLSKGTKKETFLLFSGPDESRMALVLSALARLEEMPASAVEKSGNRYLTQYRGKILPLIYLKSALEERRTEPRHPRPPGQQSQDDPLQVLVCNCESGTVGIVVENILDIVEDAAEVRHPAARRGVLYSVVINDRITELIDIPGLLERAEMQQRNSIMEYTEAPR